MVLHGLISGMVVPFRAERILDENHLSHLEEKQSIMSTIKPSLVQVSDFELKQLRVFKSVVDCGGFAAAETTLNISRPTISIHIANLETRLNLILCKRGRGGFSLTEEGAIVYEQTNKLLEHLDGFRNTVNNLSSSPTGQLKVALSDTLSLDPRTRLPQIIKQFTEQAPDVELFIDTSSMSEIEGKVLNDKLDIGFIPYHRKLEGLTYVHLFTENNYLYCGQDHSLFNLSEAQLTEDLINDARLVHAGLKPHEEVYNNLCYMRLAGVSYFYESRIAMILSGHYIGFLPEAVAKPYVEQGQLKQIAMSNKVFPLGMAVVCKKSIHQNRAKELFMQTIEQIFLDYNHA